MLTSDQKHSWERWARWSPVRRTSFPWTTGLSQYAFPLGIFLLTLFHFWLAAYLPPAEDELYYWNWAQHLQWSYYDHPGMVAYLIRASTAVFGQSIFAIRLFACLVGSLVFFLLTLLSQRVGILRYLFLTPIFLLGSVLMTPDIPLVLFWALYVIWLVGVNRTFSGWEGNPLDRVYTASPVGLARWGLGGLLLGLGLLSKYTMALAVPCTIMVLSSHYRLRAWLSGFLFHCVVAAALCLPILVFNIHYDFASFRFQWAHASMGSWHFSAKDFFEYLGGQVLLIGALPFLMLPWVLLRARELTRDPRLGVCFHFFVLPTLFFLVQALRGKLEANWPLVSYVTFWPIAQSLLDQLSFRGIGSFLVKLSFAIPLLCTAILLAHVIRPLESIPTKNDRLGKLSGQMDVARLLAQQLPEANPQHLPVYADSYQWTSYFRYVGVPAEQVHPATRDSNFTLDGRDVCRERAALVFQSAWFPPPALKCFGHRETERQYSVMVRGQEQGRFQLVKYWH